MSAEFLLQGKLAIEIRSARNLPNLDYTWYRRSNDSDPYVIVLLDDEELVRSKYLPDDNNPNWNESYMLDLNLSGEKLRFVLWDKDPGLDDKIGSVEFRTRDLWYGEPQDGWFDVMSNDGETVNGQIQLRVRFTGNDNKTLIQGKLAVEIRSAKDIPDLDFLNKKSDAFVQVVLGNDKLVTTKHVHDTHNPEWNETYLFDVCHFTKKLEIVVLEKDPTNSDKVGAVSFSVSDLLDGEKRDDWYDILGDDGRTANGHLNLCICHIPHTMEESSSYEVQSYFPARQNCPVTLYQDAHINENMIQFVGLDPEQLPKSCWEEMYMALFNAKHLICITGWSVHTNMKLLRGDNEQKLPSYSLGELLVKKANEGAIVNVIVWNYPRTGKHSDIPGMPDMGVQDQDTFDYFVNTKVRCIQSRPGKYRLKTDPFSHHQKAVVCDAPGIDPLRTLVAFVGS